MTQTQIRALAHIAGAGGQLTRGELTRHMQRIGSEARDSAVRGLARRGYLEILEQIRLRSGPKALLYRLTDAGWTEYNRLIEDGLLVVPDNNGAHKARQG